ncbi:MAG TPA: adenosylcobinamide amidohydrolase [Methylomirabilota bacterium]|nr:adenosylcobinamide amidohydrolase [Methylomirabilota bacterium]
MDGVEVAVDREAVVVTARAALTAVSSALVGGGLGAARAIVNLHVPKDVEPHDVEARLAAFAARRGVPAPWIGLLTSAWTEKAEVAEAAGHGLGVLAVVTVGLSNRVAAGVHPAAVWASSTINAIVVVDAAAEPAALVNAVMTVTEVKTALLVASGVRCADGTPASGTSTDAVVVAATGRGRLCRFGGPVSELGSVIARAARAALTVGVERWLAEHP